MKKIIIAAALMAAMTAGCAQSAAVENSEYRFGNKILVLPDYLEIEELYCMEKEEAGENFGLYNPDELTAEILTSRTPEQTIIERCIGIVEGTDGSGKILNTESPYDYISYSGVRSAVPGSVVLTYLTYDPNGTGEDDIITREDFIIAE